MYEIKEDKTARLMRVYGENGIVDIPNRIDGIPVTEIGAYCFAPQNQQMNSKELLTGLYETDNEDGLCELSGKAVLELHLPDTVTRIANNACYNCRNLQKISLPGALEEVGSDVFMNCIRLGQMEYRKDITSKSCLKQILTQISWNVEVCFTGCNPKSGNKEPEGIFFYPEYFEGYDEIGPAHIFELNISGEGFRARQCFKDGVLSIAEYDDIFQKACGKEPEQNLFRIASNRICYPVGLTQEHKVIYITYLKEHQYAAEKQILLNGDFDLPEKQKRLECLLREGCMEKETAEQLTRCASDHGMAELSVCLMKWKKMYFVKDQKSRYEFEDF